MLLPEPAEAGRGCAVANYDRSSRHPEDQGADRPGKGQGREGKCGGPWLKTPESLFWNTSRRNRLSSRRPICLRRPGSGKGCPSLPFRPDASWTSTGNLSNTLLTQPGGQLGQVRNHHRTPDRNRLTGKRNEGMVVGGIRIPSDPRREAADSRPTPSRNQEKLRTRRKHMAFSEKEREWSCFK